MPESSPSNEGIGHHSNPRRYEKDYGFYSAVTTIGALATAIWTVLTTPARTAGQRTTIYSIHIENQSGGQGWVHLEIGGTAITVNYPVANNNTLVIDFPAGLNVGDNDIDVAGTADCVVQVDGTEQT